MFSLEGYRFFIHGFIANVTARSSVKIWEKKTFLRLWINLNNYDVNPYDIIYDNQDIT